MSNVDMPLPRVRLDLTGQRFGRLKVKALTLKIGRKVKWICRCDCGTPLIVHAGDLRSGNTKSCGCLQVERAREANTVHRHGEGSYRNGRTPEFIAWQNMVARCSNPQHPSFRYYGGRGINVCERWRSSYENFLADMGRRPSPDLTLDRINNNGNYEPDNCRWATHSDQMRNRRPKGQVS